MDECPMCGQDYDADDDEITACSECGMDGSTACCIKDGICEGCREDIAYQEEEEEEERQREEEDDE